MSTVRPKTVTDIYKGRIMTDLKQVVSYSEDVSSCVEEIISKFKERVKCLTSNNNFYDEYQKLKSDFETFTEKIFLVLSILSLDCSEQIAFISSFVTNQSCNPTYSIKDEAIVNVAEREASSLAHNNGIDGISDNLDLVGNKHFQTNSYLKLDQPNFAGWDNINGSSSVTNGFQIDEPYGNSLSDCQSSFSGVSLDNTSEALIKQCFPIPVPVESHTYNALENNSTNSSSSYEADRDVLQPLQFLKDSVSSVSSSDNTSIDALKRIKEPIIELQSNISAVVTYSNNPMDFWMQLCDIPNFSLGHHNWKISSADFKPLNPDIFEHEEYCLAPSKQKGLFHRCKILSQHGSGQEKKLIVLYIDYGNVGNVRGVELQLLPKSAYSFPALAIHCCLNGVSAIGEGWSAEAKQQFLDLVAYPDLQTFVVGKEDGLFVVDLTVTLVEMCSVATMLCLYQLALPNNKSTTKMNVQVVPNESHPSANVDSIDLTSIACCSNSYVRISAASSAMIENCFSAKTMKQQTFYAKENSFSNESIQKSETHNLISGESVTVLEMQTKEQELHSKEIIPQGRGYLSSRSQENMQQRPPTENSCIQTSSVHSEEVFPQDVRNQSLSRLQNVQSGHETSKNLYDYTRSTDSKKSVEISRNQSRTSKKNHQDLPLKTFRYQHTFDPIISKLRKPKFDWSLNIPPPEPKFSGPNLLLVIPSVVLNPQKFYVHPYVENSHELDELQEFMYTDYNLPYSQNFVTRVDDIKVGIFCSVKSRDSQYWNRVQVMGISERKGTSANPKVSVYYIDLGNREEVDLKDLRPLTWEFARIPAFALPCSLSYISPVSQHEDPDECASYNRWDEESKRVFKELLNTEKYLTAQITSTNYFSKRMIYEVLLWQHHDTGDCLINDLLVDNHLAETTLFELVEDDLEESNANILTLDEDANTKENNVEVSRAKENTNDSMVLEWDPMNADFDSAMNSYGVQLNDLEVATVGYKACDERTICKYYSRNKTCFRGDNCPYEHREAGCGATTKDKEEIFVLNSIPLLPPSQSVIIIQIACIMGPNHFYAVLPFGKYSVSQVHARGNKECARYKEYTALITAINDYYSKAPFNENTLIALPPGSLVVAKSKIDGYWQRGCVVDSKDTDKEVKVFFVDIGVYEWVERRNIRTIKQEFTHTPVQAVECFLEYVNPANYEKGGKWSYHACHALAEVAKDQFLLCFVDRIIGGKMYLTVMIALKDHKIKMIGDMMVRNNFAQYSDTLACIQWIPEMDTSSKYQPA